MAWVTPTSAEDMTTVPSGAPSSATFTDTGNVWDDDTETSAYSVPDFNASGIRAAIKASHSSILCDKVRGYVSSSVELTYEMWVYYGGAWHSLGYFTTVDDWQEFALDQARTIEDMAVEVIAGDTVEGGVVYELEFGEVEIPAQTILDYERGARGVNRGVMRGVA
jgi:hypothetical protein